MTGKLLFWALVTFLAVSWFFQGNNPMHIVKQFVGRGKKLTTSSLDDSGNLRQSVDEIVKQVRNALGREISEDAVLLARMSASEHAGASEREKQAMQWVCKNDADSHGWSIRYTVTVNPGTLGEQTGRRYSTRGGGALGEREIHEDDVFVAESILAGDLPDITGGATKFVHMTGYRRFSDFLAGHPKVKQWSAEGLVPVALGDVSTLVVLLPKDKVTAEMQTLATEEPA